MESIDTHLFVEIILSEGVQQLCVHDMEGVQIGWYQGPSGKRVQIIISDENMPVKEAKFHLIQLGLHGLIERLFPPKTEKELQRKDKFTGKTFHIAGVLSNITVPMARDMVECNGGKVQDGLSSSLTYLVAGNNCESEVEIAKEFPTISILTEDDFLVLVG